uniref:Uncharacterized protein n=1 Tax=Sphaerodactylus townsendi TaxID=933632 RepID=A0ACB8E8V9_9SAUR
MSLWPMDREGRAGAPASPAEDDSGRRQTKGAGVVQGSTREAKFSAATSCLRPGEPPVCQRGKLHPAGWLPLASEAQLSWARLPSLGDRGVSHPELELELADIADKDMWVSTKCLDRRIFKMLPG